VENAGRRVRANDTVLHTEGLSR